MQPYKKKIPQMQKYKILNAKEIIVLFFLLTSLQSCKAIKAAHTEIDYSYLYEMTAEERKSLIDDRNWERAAPTLPKKKGVRSEK